MRTFLAVFLGKLTHTVTQILKLGAGGTWPGEIAVSLHPQILQHFSSQFKEGVIIVAGTNGKTTTSLMITSILEETGKKVIHNATGANLLNGVVSACIQKVSWLGKIDADWGVFEVDENSLPIVLKQLSFSSSSESQASREATTENKEGSRLRSNSKLVVVLLNLFRDQLDRYGEVDVIAEKWEKALRLSASRRIAQGKQLTLILNADDPLIAHLGKSVGIYSSSEAKTSREVTLKDPRFRKDDTLKESSRLRSNNKLIYFGVNDKKHFLKEKEHATDSTFCLNCGARLTYSGIYYSHIGIWKCTSCGEKRPTPDISSWDAPLPGLYNLYNTLAAVSVAKSLDISDASIKDSLKEFHPAFGRQEEFEIDSKKIKLFLSKNPAGFNASLRTVLELKPKAILLVLNDRIPDGRDVSWIWDVDFETIPKEVKIIVSGDRVYDLALRIKYGFQQFNNVAMKQLVLKEDLSLAIKEGLESIKNGEVLYVLPTYSAMLEVRKILTGRKIL